MLRQSTTGLKTRQLLAQTLGSCLPEGLPYNWDEKLRVHNVPGEETILVSGCQEIWVGVLLADRTVLPLTRRLWSEKGPDSASMNLVEEVEIRRAVAIIRETFKLGVILVADSGYRRKGLLH